MGKKESLNPFDYRDSGQPLSSNPFEARNQLSSVEQVASQSIGLDAGSKANAEFDANINSIMDKIPELNKEERDYIFKAGKSGQLSRQELQSAIDVMRGADVKQQQYISTSGEVKQLKNVSELAKEQAAKGEGFTLESINEGVDNLFAQTGKLFGRGQYYMKDNGKGIKVPVALAIGERPEAGYTVDSVWGSEYDAEDDNRGTDIAKKIVNLIPQTIQGILSLPELAQGLATGETGTSFKTAKNLLESVQFKTADKYNESVIDTSKVKTFSDVFDSKVYDMSADKLLNTAVNAGTSILQLFLTRGALGFTGATGGIAKAGNVISSFTTNLAEPLKAADDAGVKDRDKYLVALAYSSVATGLELGMGIEGKILNSTGKSAQKSFVKNLIKDNVEVVGGRVTKESLDKLYAETVKTLPSFWARNAKNVVNEASEEVLQNMAQNGIQQIHDELVKDDPEAAKYNSKLWSPESLGEYINSAIGGAIGGVGGSVFTKSDKQSKITYDAVSNDKETELKADLTSSLRRGAITQDEYDRSIFKIDAYKEYFEATANRPIDDENKRKIFDLTYEKQNIKSSIETLKEKNPNGINDPFIAQKESELKDITNQVNEIWAKANPSANPVVEAKAEVPAWRVSLDDFTKEIKNPDKTVSQTLRTKKDILTATGIDTNLNKLAKAFNIEFKTPRVPEESGPIQVKDGILYEPYMTEKTENKDSELKTRGLPVFAFEDKDGGAWLFAAGEQTDNNVPDTSYLIKLNEDGSYGGHEEFHYETPKMNMLSFDDIKDVFNKLELTPIATAKEAKRYTSVASEEDVEEDVEYEVGPEEQLYNDVYNDVKSGIERGKLTALPNNTLGVIVNGRTIPFADSAATNSRMNKEAMPSGDVEIGIRAVEGIQTNQGEMTGLMVYNVETGEDIGYLRATEKSMGRRKVKKNYATEQEIDIPTTLTEKGKEVLDKLKAESEGFTEEVTTDGNRIYVKGNKIYETISSYLNKDVNYQGKPGLKEAALKVGATIDVILKDFFNGKVKAHSEYADIMSEDDYNDVIQTLDSVRKHAVKKGYSIITEKVILADDKKKIAGSPNIIMVSKEGDVYVYDTAAVRSTITQKTNSRRNFNDLFTKPTGKNNEFPAKQEKIIAKLEIFKDILESKSIEVEGIGAVPFEVDYEFDSKGTKVVITHVKKVGRYDFMEEGAQPKNKPVSVTAKPSVAPAKTTVRRVTMPIQAKVAPVVEPVPGEEMAVSNLVDKRVEYKGKEGVIKRDEGGKLTFESGDTIVELTAKDVAKEIVPETFALENGKVKLGTETFDYVSTNRNSKGEIVSVNLKNSKGKVITKRDAELATVIDRTINKSTVDNAMSSSPEFKKEVKSTINRKFKEEFLGDANRVIDSMPDSVSETFVEMESGVSEKSTEELQLMVLEASEWASKAKADIKKSKAPDFEKRSATNMLDKFEKDLNKYYAKLDKQRKSEIAAAAKEKARLDFERAGGKIKKSFSEEELNTLSQGKTIEVTEGMTEEDFIEEVYNNSENPAQIASAYLMEEKPSEFGENKKTGTKEDTIYEFFAFGGRLSEKAFDAIYDKKLRNKSNIKGINRYVAGPNYKGNRTPEDADILGLKEADDSITTEDVVNFINAHPNGPSDYSANIEGSMRSKLAYKFKGLTGKVLNPNRARELNNKLIDIEAESTKEAQKVAEKLSPRASENMMPEGKDIITGDDSDVAFQKKSAFRSEKAAPMFNDSAQKAISDFKADKNTKVLSFKDVVNKSKDKLSVELFKVLSKYATGKIYYQDGYSFNGGSKLVASSGYGATIDGEGNVLIFHNGNLNLDTILHELMHNLLFEKINDTARGPKDQKLVNELNRIFEKTKPILSERYGYAYSNLDEFVSEALGNSAFRQELSYIEDIGFFNKKSDMFSSFVNAIKDFLKSKYNFEINKSALESILNSVQYTLENNQKVKSSQRESSVNDAISYLKKVLGNKVDFLPYKGDKNIAGYVEKKSGDTKAKVYINEDYAGLDTPIHEVGHILIDSIGYNNRVIQAAIKQLKDTDLWKETAKAYPELNEEGLGKEVLAEAIGREGAGIFEEQTAKSKFKQFLDYIFDKVKQLFGVDRNIAKSMAKQVLAGNVKVTKDLEIKKQEQKFRKLPREEYYKNNYGGQKFGIQLSTIEKGIAQKEAELAADPNNKELAEELKNKKAALENFERAYVKYTYDYNKLNKVKANNGDLEGKSLDELLELYNIISEYDPNADDSFFGEVKYRIAAIVSEEQRMFLESKGLNVPVNKFKDIKSKDILMKSLGHMTEAFPQMQYLSKAYDAAVMAFNEEKRETKKKLDELGVAVAKEEANTLGLKVKDFFTGQAYKFFAWMDKGNGEMISTDDAYRLSKAKGDYVKFQRELKEKYKDLQEDTPIGYDDNALLMTDKNFAERKSSNGVVAAIQHWLGSNSGVKKVVMNYTHSDKRSEPLSLGEIELALQKEAEKGLISAAIAASKSIYYNARAKKILKAGKTDEAGNDVSAINNADFVLDKKGKLINKFGVSKPANYDYSKDFHAAAVQYLNDMAWTKHLQPLIPLVESIEHFNKVTGAGSKASMPNLTKWMENWKKMHVYKDKHYSPFPEIDMVLKVLRNMTSMTSLAFNVGAAKMNFVIGEYNNWREMGGINLLKGHKRLVASTKSGESRFSTKAHNILMKNNVIATDYDEMATMRAGRMLQYAAQGLTKLTEYTIQGSMFLGQMSNQEWNDFDRDGNYIGSDPKIKEKIEAYKRKVSDVHGKYSAKDRRNFELYEFGKFVGQFKTWIPDWWKERFGSEYIDEQGKRHKGNWNGFLKYAISDLRKDIIKPEFWTSDKLEYVNARKNLKAAMTFGLLMAIQAGGDEDKKKRVKADFLSQAIGNLTFIFDPEQAKYVLKTPFAGMSYANAMLDAMTSLNGKKIKKIIPYNKMADVIDYND